MDVALGLLTIAGLYPMARAWAANKATTMRPSLAWAGGAILAWSIAALRPTSLVWPYVALSMSACAGVAVLGARRPGEWAWSLVVAGLLCVLLLPVATGLGKPRLEAPQLAFLGITLSIVLLNHLPTRPGTAVPMLAVAFAVELAWIAGVGVSDWLLRIMRTFVALAPWVAWVAVSRPVEARDADRLWVNFRDRYGILWAERVREQFNRSAMHSGLPERLTWFGLRPPGMASEDSTEILHSLLKRFNSEGSGSPG